MTNPQISELAKRFHNFDDGVLRAIELRYPTRTRRGFECMIMLSAKDADALAEHLGGWVNVILEVSEVRQFRFTESSKESNQVLSGGISFLETTDGFIYLVLNEADPPADPTEAGTLSHYLCGRNLRWKIEPYSSE